MSKDEFINEYCRRSGAERASLSQHVVALFCRCGEEHCLGWAMVSNNAEDIATHNELYGEKCSPIIANANPSFTASENHASLQDALDAAASVDAATLLAPGTYVRKHWTGEQS